MAFLDSMIFGIRELVNAAGTAVNRRSRIKVVGATLADDEANDWTLMTIAFNGIEITGTPAVGAIPRATSATTAEWGQLNLADNDALTGTLPVARGGTGITTFGTGVATFLGTPSGANLASALTSALPDSKGGTGLTALGSGVATFLGTPSSANLISALTDETGTGACVFGTAPLFKTTINFNNPTDTFKYVITSSHIAANRILTLPTLVSDDTMVTEAHTQALTNKTITVSTIDAASNTHTGFVSKQTNGLRLTGTTALPVTTADVATTTSVYLTPYISGDIALYDGTRWNIYTTTQATLSLGTLTSGKNYDVFAYASGSTVTLEALAWTDDTNRATALVRQDGVWCKTGALTRRYVGTFRTISTTATCDTVLQRYIYNQDNKTPRRVVVNDATDSWTYINPSAVWRQARAQTTNGVEYVCGDVTSMQLRCYGGATSATNSTVALGVGIDSTTVNSAQMFGGTAHSTTSQQTAFYDGQSAVGYHKANWLETGLSGAITYTFVGDNGNAIVSAGMSGTLLM